MALHRARFIIVPLLFLFSVTAWSAKQASRGASAPIISVIEITGNKRIEAPAVLDKISQKKDKPVDYSKIPDDIRALYALGYFDAIEIHDAPDAGGKIKLEVRVVERPVVGAVAWEGLDEMKEEDFKDIVTVKKYAVFNPSLATESATAVREHYENKGFYLAQVKWDIEPMPNTPSEVKVIFRVRENDKVRVKKITFLGNKVFSDSDLKGIMQTREGGFFSFLTDAGNFQDTILERDATILQYWYYNHGYVQIEIGKPEVYVSPDQKWIYITFHIKEGEQYRIGKIGFQGELLFTEEELRRDLILESGEVFSGDKMRTQVLNYTAKYGDLGYAFANVVPAHEPRPEERLIDINFSVERGPKVTIGRIMMSGNTKTRDKVIRRELLIHEGELYNETRLRKSRENVERLGFFERGVAFNKSVRPGTRDILDISIVVKEKNTGTLTVSAGYSSAESFIATTQISQENFLGRGQRLAFYGMYSRTATRFNLSFDEPYFWDTVWSLGGDLYRAERQVTNSYNVLSYRELKLGGDVRVGHPIAEYVRLSGTWRLEDVKILEPFNGINVITAEDQGLTSSLAVQISRDTRDNRLDPSDGSYAMAGFEVAGVGGDQFFTRTTAKYSWYHPLFWKFVFKTNVEYGYVGPIAGQHLPVPERFVLGGPYNLRGYNPLSVGSRVCATGTREESPGKTLSQVLDERGVSQGPCAGLGPGFYPFVIGGRHKALGSAEIEFPVFEQVGIRLALFADVGNAFDSLSGIGASLTDPDHPFSDGPLMLANWGFEIRWFSPIGPLRFIFGWPFVRQPGGTLGGKFNFTIGPSF